MSLWSFAGAPPSNGQPVSVEVTDFQFTAQRADRRASSPAMIRLLRGPIRTHQLHVHGGGRRFGHIELSGLRRCLHLR
jgi:hypothetical protein